MTYYTEEMRPPMLERFSGADGRRAVLAVLADHQLVEHSREVAERLAEHGKVVAFATGETLIHQGSADAGVFFILSGHADVFVNGRIVNSRNSVETVGEMAAIDPAAPRSATVRAKTPLVALELSAEAFLAVADRTPRLWRALAKVLAGRLRQRERFHRKPNSRPELFLGSSKESLAVAHEVQKRLSGDAFEVRLWTCDVFPPGGVPLDDLLMQAHRADFAVLVCNPDDFVTSRSKQQNAPRDNVVLELGIFVGQLGRERVYMLRPSDSDIKVPTDLLGITPLIYSILDSRCSLASALEPCCNDLRKAIQRLGVR
jgi:CRP/FNR family transcriptional regulator, cyclic AMP receptor protein